jgi:hypothetical protein
MATARPGSRLARAALVLSLLPLVLGGVGFLLDCFSYISELFALFLVVPAFFACPPVALALAIAAFVRAKGQPDARAIRARGGIAVGVSLLTAALVAIAVPAFRRYRAETQRNLCISHMSLLNHAKEVYAMEHDLKDGDTIPEAGAMEYVNGFTWETLSCPTAGSNTYTIGKAGEDPCCAVHGTLGHCRYRDGQKSDWQKP